MKIAVYGTGGVGGYFGGRLAESGQDVHFIARGQHLEAMRENGLRVDSINGDFVIDPVQATDNPADIGEVDCVLVCVKAWQVPLIAESIKPMMGDNTFVVPLENGVESSIHLAEVLGEDNVLGGLCRIFSYIEGPGHITHMGSKPYVTFGELDNSKSEREQQLFEAFDNAGVHVEVAEDINVSVWTKFLFICAISGVGAVTRAPMGTIRSLPETRAMLRGCMQEAYDLAVARGVNMPDDSIDKMMHFVDTLPDSATASMQRDIMDGKPSELESQNGAVTRLGELAGVDTPINRFIYHSLLPMEKLVRGEIEFPE